MKISFVGTGNLAWGIAGNLHPDKTELLQVVGRNPDNLRKFTERFGPQLYTTELLQISPDADLVVVAIPDDAIAEVAQQIASSFLTKPRTVFVHCSGSAPLQLLHPLAPHSGVMWPVQTFTRGVDTPMKDVPVFIEGTSASSIAVIQSFADSMSHDVRLADSGVRQKLHLGAVFAANFPNLCYTLAEEITSSTAVAGFDVYHQLIREAVQKAFEKGPREAQTGPAKRGDTETIRRHIELLTQDNPQAAELYRIMSALISKK